MKKHLAAITLLALLTTACGGVEKDASYESVEDLREAVLASEHDCPGETPDGDKDEGEVLIVCGDGTVLRWFAEDGDLAIGKVALNVGLVDADAYLTGPNWIVRGQTDALDDLQQSLGGELTAL